MPEKVPGPLHLVELESSVKGCFHDYIVYINFVKCNKILSLLPEWSKNQVVAMDVNFGPSERQNIKKNSKKVT